MHAQVLQLVPAPTHMGTAWDACVASVGADGIVGVLSLQAGGFCQRMLPGHPLGRPLHLQWVASLGFLACLCPASGAPSPSATSQQTGAVAIVWDLQSGTWNLDAEWGAWAA